MINQTKSLLGTMLHLTSSSGLSRVDTPWGDLQVQVDGGAAYGNDSVW